MPWENSTLSFFKDKSVVVFFSSRVIDHPSTFESAVSQFASPFTMQLRKYWEQVIANTTGCGMRLFLSTQDYS